MNILTAPNEILTQPCDPVSVINFSAIDQMMALMQQHGGLGLAAPQVGVQEQFFVTHWGEVFVNPMIFPVREDGRIDVIESCLSIPGKSYVVSRWRTVRVGKKVYGGQQAIVIQHEADHLRGVLISDIGTLEG